MFYSKLPATSFQENDSCPGQRHASIHYRLYVAECIELERHKWFESEKAGRDIGMEHARVDWYRKHRAAWLSWWLKNNAHVAPAQCDENTRSPLPSEAAASVTAN
jgi:hypothetical protein